jgi:hypothetical protein
MSLGMCGSWTRGLVLVVDFDLQVLLCAVGGLLMALGIGAGTGAGVPAGQGAAWLCRDVHNGPGLVDGPCLHDLLGGCSGCDLCGVKFMVARVSMV